MVKRWAQRAGIERPVTIHTLRHTFATHYRRESLDEAGLQKLLGHRDPKTTRKYGRVLDRDLAERVEGLTINR